MIPQMIEVDANEYQELREANAKLREEVGVLRNRLLSAQSGNYYMEKSQIDLEKENARLRACLERITDHPNCHPEWTDEYVRTLPDASYLVVTAWRCAAKIAAEGLGEGENARSND